MHFFYNIGIYFYGFGIRVASLFNTKAKQWVDGRKNLFDKLPDTHGKEVIWFHCASLGEFDQGLPLMEKIKHEQPNCFLLITFFSPSGMNFHHKRKHDADFVMYLPLDTPGNAKKFIQHFSPSSAFFVKYEFWSNLIASAKKSGTKLYNVSGIFRPDHRFFKASGGFFRKTLGYFDWFFVQNQESLTLLKSIDIHCVSISGDSRFDRVLDNKKNVTENAIISSFKGEKALIVIGSSWPEDENVLIPWIKSFDGKVLIAPHNVDETHVKSISSSLPNSVRYTQFKEDESTKKILILDTIGQLANAYSYGRIAYVGGGFSGSLHNILEPAVFGLPVIFGPKHSRFPEGQHFIDQGIGFSIDSTETFKAALNKINASYSDISNKTEEFVESNKGAAEKIWKHITAS